MHSLNLKIKDEHHDKLRTIAFQSKVSIASIVRAMIEDGLLVEELNDLPKEE